MFKPTFIASQVKLSLLSATMHPTLTEAEMISKHGLRTFAVWMVVAIILTTGTDALAQTNILPMAKPESVGMSSERLKRIDARMQDYIDKKLVAGAVTLVARKGKIVHYNAQGYSWIEGKKPMEKDNIFVIMSMTKPIVSTALMMLYEEGKFLLTDPISKWIPEFENMQATEEVSNPSTGARTTRLVPARAITVRHVLTHTSGVTAGQRGAAPAAAAAGARGAATGARGGAGQRRVLADGVIALSRNPLLFQPGTEWNYGSSTDVVALLAERISGMNMDDFLRERIFKPLKMNDTYYNVPESKTSRKAAAYRPVREKGNTIELSQAPQTNAPTTYFGGVAGLSSTAADYFRYAQMMLNGGELDGVRLLSPKTVDLMITNHIGDLPVALKGPGYGFGLGYSVLKDPGKASEPLSPGSGGWGGAWGTYFFVDPVEEMTAILMIQLTSYNHLTIRADLTVLATQAIIDARSSGAHRIMGYAPLN
jgi:CubicO group peptidase (beta-lactamase class C family)